MLLTLKRLPYNVNITFKGPGKPEDVSDWLYWDTHFIVVVWNSTEISPRYACAKILNCTGAQHGTWHLVDV